MIKSIKTEITDKLGWTSKEFTDEAEFDKYVQSSNYAKDINTPAICFGI